MVGSSQFWTNLSAIAVSLFLALMLALVSLSSYHNPIPDVQAAHPIDGVSSIRQVMESTSDLSSPTGPTASNAPTDEMMHSPSTGPNWQPIAETSQPTTTPTTMPTTKEGDKPTTQDAGSSSSKRPHIVMVVIDDMGYADLGFKGSGIRTPTIDQLVAAGTRLTNYYVLPACTHTRVALLSGKYPYRSGIYKVLEVGNPSGMNTKDKTLANDLTARGYLSHAVGKWHLGHAWYDYLPTFRGFRTFFGCWLNNDHFTHNEIMNRDDVEAYDLHLDTREKCGDGCATTRDYRGKYSTTIFTDRAVKLIQNKGKSPGKPLFLYLAYQALHTPLQVPPEYLALYKSKPGWNDARKTYAAMLTAVDDGIAAVVKTLQEEGLWENTLMIITTDNGAPGGQGGSNTPLRGYKMQTYEGAVRADGMIVGPARKKLGIVGGVNPRQFHALDWMPTLTDLSDSTVDPSNLTDWSHLDGVSQVRSLRGGEANRREAFLGFDYHDETNTGLAYRSGNLKLIRLSDGSLELYDVTNDITESTNLWTPALAPMYKERVSQINRRIRWYKKQFTTKPPPLGQCPRVVSFGKTPWNKPLLIPWCNAELD